MGRGILLWLLGIPLPIIILLFSLLALADMSQPDSQRDETNAPVAEKRERSEVNSAARVRQILGPAIADRL